MQLPTILDTREPIRKSCFPIPLFSRVSASHLKYLAIPLTKIQETYTKPSQGLYTPTQKPKSQPRHRCNGRVQHPTIDTGEQEREHDCEERIHKKRTAGLEKHLFEIGSPSAGPELSGYNAAYCKYNKLPGELEAVSEPCWIYNSEHPLAAMTKPKTQYRYSIGRPTD